MTSSWSASVAILFFFLLIISWQFEIMRGHLDIVTCNRKEITWSMTSRCIRSCSCCSLLRLLRRPLSLGDACHNNEVEIMSWRNRILIMAIIVKVFFTSNLELCVAVACPVDKLLQRWEHYNAFFTICWSQPFTIGSSWSLGQSRPAGGKA